MLDRFWVLERSVDLDGADFIIQRRLTGGTLFDPNPPRLGKVQAKFFGSEDTTHYIHREYVIDPDGKPRTEFFLICHTGYERDARSFAFGAQDIVEGFAHAPEGHARQGQFVLPGRQVLVGKRFEIISPGLVLSRMENTLRLADFVANRRFMSWALPTRHIEQDQIDTLYLEPIDNWWGPIPDGFRTLKSRARSAVASLEEPLYFLQEILQTTDPAKALSAAEELSYNFGDTVRLPNGIYDQDFHAVVLQHREQYESLRSSGILDQFLAVRSACMEHISSDPTAQAGMGNDEAYVIQVKYRPEDFGKVRFESSVSPVSSLVWEQAEDRRFWRYADAPDSFGLLASERGCVRAYWLNRRYGYAEGPTASSWRRCTGSASRYRAADPGSLRAMGPYAARMSSLAVVSAAQFRKGGRLAQVGRLCHWPCDLPHPFHLPRRSAYGLKVTRVCVSAVPGKGR